MKAVSHRVDVDRASTGLRRVIGPKLLLLLIVGDILGTGVYALTGQVAAEVGGAAWVPFLVAFLVALLTAFSYLELVTKYPQAAGAALYVHKAFGAHPVTFCVAFAVMCSGIASASTASRAFASNLALVFAWDASNTTIMLLALAFMTLVMGINLRGVGQSVRANAVLTLVELTGLLLVLIVGAVALTGGNADFSRVIAFDTPQDKNVFLAITTATSLAFFAMVGFEDSVNMAEECRDPRRTFPPMMLSGLGIAALIYVLVSMCAVVLVPVGDLAASDTPLTLVVERGAPSVPIKDVFPFISMVAVANSALINMMMASRLLYGMGQQGIVPRVLGKVNDRNQTPWTSIAFTTALSFGMIAYVSRVSTDAIAVLAGTTSLLLLGVFAVVNIAVIMLRQDSVEPDHFRTTTLIAAVGAASCLYLVTPLSGRDAVEYEIAGGLLLVGVVLALPGYLHRRAIATKDRPIRRSSGDPRQDGGLD
jgi:amino acid transporter